jgi:hypothetical protein
VNRNRTPDCPLADTLGEAVEEGGVEATFGSARSRNGKTHPFVSSISWSFTAKLFWMGPVYGYYHGVLQGVKGENAWAP